MLTCQYWYLSTATFHFTFLFLYKLYDVHIFNQLTFEYVIHGQGTKSNMYQKMKGENKPTYLLKYAIHLNLIPCYMSIISQ